MRFRRRRDPLGEGVWRRAHDRFRRAVDRYHQVIEPVPPGTVRNRLELVAIDLAGQLEEVRALCERAQAEAPSAGLDVPGAAAGAPTELHRRLSRAGNLAAQAAEAATMARVAARLGRDGNAEDGVAGAERAAAAARRLVSGWD